MPDTLNVPADLTDLAQHLYELADETDRQAVDKYLGHLTDLVDTDTIDLETARADVSLAVAEAARDPSRLSDVLVFDAE